MHKKLLFIFYFFIFLPPISLNPRGATCPGPRFVSTPFPFFVDRLKIHKFIFIYFLEYSMYLILLFSFLIKYLTFKVKLLCWIGIYKYINCFYLLFIIWKILFTSFFHPHQTHYFFHKLFQDMSSSFVLCCLSFRFELDCLFARLFLQFFFNQLFLLIIYSLTFKFFYFTFHF